MTGINRETTQPFPGYNKFDDRQRAGLQRTLALVKELQSHESIRSIVDRSGIGGWLSSGFGDTQGLADIESRVAFRCRAIVAIETTRLLGQPLPNEELLDLVSDAHVRCEDMPERVRDYLFHREEYLRREPLGD